MSKVINENEEYIRQAVETGISSNAINATLEGIVNKSDKLGKTPEQLKKTVEVISQMKSNVNELSETKYLSDLVNKNSSKIISALKDGVSNYEIAQILINSTERANDYESKCDLNFVVKLISEMERKELVLNRQNSQERSYQNILTK